MVNVIDLFILAQTKLRSRQLRTTITVVIAGLLFGLIIAVLFVIQGVFTSVDRYSNFGLNNRTLVSVSYSPQASLFNEYDHLTDEDFINEVEVAYKLDILKKQTVAKKYSVEYDPTVSNPSPIGIDTITKQKIITNEGAISETVQRVAQQRRDMVGEKFSIAEYIRPYNSAVLRGELNSVQPSNGALTYMKNHKENQQVSGNRAEDSMISNGSGASLMLVDASVSRPFITDAHFDPSKGEIPVIFPYSSAERLLGLPQMSKDTSPTAQKERLAYVRTHVKDITASFCYRNNASRLLMGQAAAQADGLRHTINDANITQPAVIYNPPNTSDCSAVTVKSDARSMDAKLSDENQTLFEKEVGIWQGDPIQYKVTVRGVGISGDYDSASATLSVKSLVNSLLNSTLAYGAWAIPQDLFDKLPIESKPGVIFGGSDTVHATQGGMQGHRTYLVEFGDRNQANELLRKTGTYAGSVSDITAYPFGSGKLFIDDLRGWIEKVLFWALVVVGIIAVIILWAIMGRTVADSRRESAVFRAIGATRLDIAGIYGLYALLLSLGVVVFACVLGLLIAIIINLSFSESATLSAQLAYAAVDSSIRFEFLGITSRYVVVVIMAIILAGLIASIVPIALGVRRNPIDDIRRDN